MSASTPPATRDGFESLLRFIARAAIDDVPGDQFLRSFYEQAEDLAPDMVGQIDDPMGRRAVIGQFGRIYWGATPQPHQGWRAQPIPKPERNAPCPCNSGKKYKQCCQPYEMPAEALPMLNMLKFVLDLWPEANLRQVPLLRLDPEALADAARQYLEEEEAPRGIALLEPLFADPEKLDDRYISCFDGLCDAYLEERLQTEREHLVARIAMHRNKPLASTALQRATVLASDAGDYKTAWERFWQAMRLAPDDPALSHLEVLVLRSEGRIDEAKVRAKVWASRLRRLDSDHEELIQFLEQAAADPDRALLALADRQWPEDQMWTTLLDAAPAAELLYKIEQTPTPDDTSDAKRTSIAMTALPKLARVERQWRDAFFVQKPSLTGLYGEASAACDEFAAVGEFMHANPLAWQSFEILDDLVLIARDWFSEGEGFAESAVVLTLTERAVALLQKCVAGARDGPAVVPWAVAGNRPALRLVAQRIDALLDSYSAGKGEAEFESLHEWMLQLNPNDNHGYRNPVMQSLLLSGDTQRALELAGHYPEDVGDLPFDLALALYRSGRKDEAAEAWMRGARSTPIIAKTLLAKNPAPPEIEADDDGFEVLGGPEHAWRYRTLMGLEWERSGALAWARTLPRIAPPKPKKLPVARGGQQGRQPPVAKSLQDFAKDLDETKLLQALNGYGFAVVPLHGLLTAVVMSPRMMMPGQWLAIALEYRTGRATGSIDELNAAIQPLMGLYNCINSALRLKRGEGYAPSPQLATADPAQATAWARGFMRIVELGRAAWRDKTSRQQGKAALTMIERAAAGMVADDRLQQESAALGLTGMSPEAATWHDVLGAATRALAGA